MQGTAVSIESLEDKRRSLRLHKASLTRLKLDGLDRPSIKIAENMDEYAQAFALVRSEYIKSGYLPPSYASPYYYTVYSILPESCVFVFKTYLTVIAALTEIADSKMFGLPMDSLYKAELDALRSKGKKVAELSSFVTNSEHKMRNILTYLCKAMFTYSQVNEIDYICIMVNPKHVSFYKRMFLFEEFGPEKFYDAVSAPAVALVLDLNTIAEKLREKYSGFKFEENLFHFFCRTNATRDQILQGLISGKKRTNPKGLAQYFLQYDPKLVSELSIGQLEYLCGSCSPAGEFWGH